ncbi:rod shape-determining protein RodA [Rheinheimera sp. UJ51]|uniref:rod shape-determining protein RodA n=1 Tax=unclassified Rheinheimera TaxID=115860 RepID=UPI001E473B69|nr:MULTISPECIES: rod shape-determining protein RodA [unclassified Rheinheimera]MCC5452475.1 rod shape-determining protein RodA [Rheinheimera sp. UJ51]MCF4010294.1 rod shape-determining protein RodA [Rheinheimera sp. UJ63]
MNNSLVNPPNRISKLAFFHIDTPLLLGLLTLMCYGLIVLYSASGQNEGMLEGQLIRLGLALTVMIAFAQINPQTIRRWSFPLFIFGTILLVCVLLFGHVGKGAQRWLDLGFMKFQPSEIMKLAVPMAIAWFISSHNLPPRLHHLLVGFLMCLIPTLLIAKQPDLGTSILIATAGIFVLFMAGMSWRLIGFIAALISAFAPVMWLFLMHDYQRKRVLTFINPESDPLGSGYHIIQSKIAIGSGGVDGKGWMQGTQSQLEFLPERHTDFIFSVLSEEFGLIGVLVLLAIYLFIIGRGLLIAARAQDNYSKLVAGSFTLTFFVYVFVNIGMVSGLLPVVGVPLPLVSYGGTSMVTMMAAFGIIMSVSTHKRSIAKT